MTRSTATGAQVVIGVDGGQSSTKALVGNLTGQPLGWATGGPIWHIDEPGGQERVRDAVTTSVLSALDRAGRQPGQVSVAYLALTGSTGAAEEVAADLLPQARIIVESDALAALASGAYGGPGVAVIAGTGSVAVGVGSDQSGSDHERVFRGGWGPTLGDEGSGYWIGLSALRMIARADDRLAPATELTSALRRHLQFETVRDLFNLVHASRLDRRAIAALAPLVTDAAQAGDAAAQDIVNEAVEHLTALVEVTSRSVRLHREHRRVVLSGGVLAADGPVADGLVRLIPQRLPGFEVIRPGVPPVVGAYFLALDAAGPSVNDDTLRARIQSGDWPAALRLTSQPIPTTQGAKSS